VRRGLAAALLISWASIAHAADTVTVGAIYPLGLDPDDRAAIETAAEIVNTPHPGLETLLLGAGQGLPHLGGAKITVDFANDLANPSAATGQALRLVTQDHVAALIGAGGAAEMLAASALAERHGVPFLAPDAEAPSVTGRGSQWVFRTTPLAGDFARAYIQFLSGLKIAGTKIVAVATVFPATDQGSAFDTQMRSAAKAAGFTYAAGLGYSLGAADLSPVVMGLKAGHPDVVIIDADLADARLLVTTMNTLGYRPPLLIGDDAGFSDPAFVTAVGNLAQGLIDRSVWSAGKEGSPTAIINDLFKAKSGHDLDDRGARIMQGLFVLADAIDHSGSTDAAAIREALQATDLKPDGLIVGYDGVKFDATGQNVLAATYLTQLRGKQYVTVWPTARAAGKLELPFRGWE